MSRDVKRRSARRWRRRRVDGRAERARVGLNATKRRTVTGKIQSVRGVWVTPGKVWYSLTVQ